MAIKPLQTKKAPKDKKSVAPKKQFPEISPLTASKKSSEFRSIKVPNHRRSPVKRNWKEIVSPLVDQMKLQVRMNISKGQIELRNSPETESSTALQKGADFVKAFVAGFAVKDALAILRLEDIYMESFMVTDIRILKKGHLPRAIGRIVGRNGKTKFTIENSTKTRIVIADQHVHILGSFQNIRVAKTTLVRLIAGAQPGKVYSQMQVVAAKNKYRY